MMFEDNVGEDGLSPQSSYTIDINDSNYIDNLASDPAMFDNDVPLGIDTLIKVYPVDQCIEWCKNPKKNEFNPLCIVEGKIWKYLYRSSESQFCCGWMWWHWFFWLESSLLLRLFLVMWWYWEMSNAQCCNSESNREVATLWFGRQPFQCRSWNTQTSVCWICFILYPIQCIDVVSSTQLCHILHRLKLQYCCNLLIDYNYKTSYSFQHAGSSF